MIDLEKRIEDALKAYCSNKDSMHVPPRNTDIDIVLSDCLKTITDLKKQLDEVHKSRASWVEYKNKVENPEYVLVPRRPTDESLKSISGNIDNAMHIYKAMIEAVEKDDKTKD